MGVVIPGVPVWAEAIIGLSFITGLLYALMRAGNSGGTGGGGGGGVEDQNVNVNVETEDAKITTEDGKITFDGGDMPSRDDNIVNVLHNTVQDNRQQIQQLQQQMQQMMQQLQQQGNFGNPPPAWMQWMALLGGNINVNNNQGYPGGSGPGIDLDVLQQFIQAMAGVDLDQNQLVEVIELLMEQNGDLSEETLQMIMQVIRNAGDMTVNIRQDQNIEYVEQLVQNAQLSQHMKQVLMAIFKGQMTESPDGKKVNIFFQDGARVLEVDAEVVETLINKIEQMNRSQLELFINKVGNYVQENNIDIVNQAFLNKLNKIAVNIVSGNYGEGSNKRKDSQENDTMGSQSALTKMQHGETIDEYIQDLNARIESEIERTEAEFENLKNLETSDQQELELTQNLENDFEKAMTLLKQIRKEEMALEHAGTLDDVEQHEQDLTRGLREFDELMHRIHKELQKLESEFEKEQRVINQLEKMEEELESQADKVDEVHNNLDQVIGKDIQHLKQSNPYS